MDRALYTAMTGAEQTYFAQSVHSNNLANINTVGFRADLEYFSSLPVEGEGLPTRTLSVAQKPAVSFAPGSMMSTGRELDLAVQGEGFFAVQSKTGEEQYTRAGDFSLSPDGLLLTKSGEQVLGNGGPITIPPAQKIDIGSDGTISIIPLGGTSQTLAVIDRIKLVNPEIATLEKSQDGFLRKKDGSDEVADPNMRVASGMLESSNVNAIEELTRIIDLSRSYELQVKLMKQVEENDASVSMLTQSS